MWQRRLVVAAAAATLGWIGIPQLHPGAASASNTAIAPSVSTIESGLATGGLADIQTIDSTALQLGPGLSRSYRTYQLPSNVSAANIWSFAVKAQYSGPLKSKQVWTWYLRDFSTNAWAKIGDNLEVATANVPKTLRFYPAGPFARFVSSTGALQVRSVSGNKPLSMNLDAEWIEFDAGPKPTFSGWKPALGTRWQYQLQPPVDTTVSAVPWTGGPAVHPDVFDIDLYESDGITPASPTVNALHANGAKAICYVDAGTYENWRPDAALFPTVIRGAYNGWPGERWLDIRRLDVIGPIIDARVAKCVGAGFDAVEFDNMDGASNVSGFKVSQAQQVEFNRAMADIAHARGLAVGLKNDVKQLTQLEPWFDFAINEQCSQYNECGGYDAWTSSAKAVAQVEYTAALSAFCPPAIAAGRSAIKKDLLLHATPYTPCN